MGPDKNEMEVAQLVLAKAKKMLDEFLQKKEEKVDLEKADFRQDATKAPAATVENTKVLGDNKIKKSEKLRNFIAKKAQKRLAKCGDIKKV